MLKQFQLIKPFFIERRLSILAGVLSLFMVDILQLFIPRVVKWAVDDIAGLNASYSELFRYCLIIVATAIFIGLFRFSWRYLIMGWARRVEEGIREKLFNHVQSLPATFFDRTTAGDIMAHATNDINNIRMAIGMGLVGLTDTIVLGGAAVIFMGYINIKLTLFALLPMPFIALFTKILSKKLFNAYMEVQHSFSQLMESTRERFAGIKVIKAFNREGSEIDAIARESEGYISKNMHLVRLRGLIFPMIILLTNISLAVVLGLGGQGVILKEISPGDFVAFISYLGLLTWPVMAVGWVANLIQRGKASIDRIDLILRTPKTIQKTGNAVNPERIVGAIDFRDVSFRYEKTNTDPPVLDRIFLAAASGKMIGITGPPGSGKTTLVNLIPRLYDPIAGSIHLDGNDIKTLDLDYLRQSVSFMPQEPFLFSGTILENLMFGDPDASDKAIKTAVAMARLTDTINGFPKGLHTVIGEKGVMLSGGQKQRIALARALLKDAPVLILDDPISQVDMQTAAHITAVIESFKGKRTVIIVSHRFSLFHNADTVIVLKAGRIIQSGNHGELIKQKGYYATAHGMQIAEEAMGRITP